jgi:holliday junction DNA helicase RuvA
MIAQVRGKLVHRDGEGAVIECGGVGYGLSLSAASVGQLPAVGSEVSLFVHTHLTQDALRLYGFTTAEERQAFVILIGTTGVGPKLALAILSTMSTQELFEVVARGDKTMLTRIPGVGPKKAERLMVELKDRLPRISGPAAGPGRISDLTSDLISALNNLGFAPAEAERLADGVIAANGAEKDLAALLRLALRASAPSS